MSSILRSNLHTAAAKDLAGVLTKASLVLAGAADRVAYSYDAAGITALPDLVVLPADTQDTAAVVKWAVAQGMPVVPRGAGTNLSGGTVPVTGGIVLELSRLNQVVSVDTRSRRAVVGPGITNLALQEHLAPLGYGFAPDPASQKVSTLGGNVGENAGGPHCLKYGVTVDHILGATVVLPDGEVVRIGYDQLEPGLAAVTALVGSEGTLGVLTEVVVRLEPLPAATKTLLVLYDRLEDAGRSVSEIIARRILPATLELMDRTTLQSVEESLHLGYPTDVEGALLIEVDGMEPGLARQVSQIEAICLENGARSVRAAKDATERARLWQGRRAAFGALARRSPIYSVQDATVPRNKLVAMMRQTEEICRRYDLPVAIVAHAGDGNLHPIILYGEATPERLAQVHAANEEMLGQAVSMGGTISGEHGVGLEKLEFLGLAVDPPTLRLMRRVKEAFDPAGLFNPRKAVPADGPSDAASSPHPGAAGLAGAVAIAQAAQSGGRVQARGTGTRSAWALRANEQAQPVFPIAGGSNQDVQVDHDNLTVTVAAATPAPVLRQALEQAGFWLPPLDHGWHGSVGGDVATDQFAPTSATLGAISRWLLGARLITGDGSEVRLGGQTMKNVAGYNLLHLLAGSYGRLGLITELTFRLWPAPEVDVTLACSFDALMAAGPDRSDPLGPWQPLIARTRPAAAVVVADPAGGHAATRVMVRLAGLTEDVEQAMADWRDAIPVQPCDPRQASALWSLWARPLAQAAGTGALTKLRAAADNIAGMLQDLAARGPDLKWVACLVSGTGWMGALSETSSVPSVTRLAWDHGTGSGLVAGPLDARLCRAFDPHGVFTPTGGDA